MNNPQLQMWSLSVHFLVGALVVLAVAVPFGVLIWITLRAWWHEYHLQRRRQQQQAARFRPDGRPYPPMAMGLCDHCGQSFDRVFFLPTGNRLCPACYRESDESGAADSPSHDSAA